MTRLAAILILCLWAMTTYGQDRLLHRVDSMAARLYYRAKTDTAYITRPDSRWIVKLRSNASRADIETHGTMNGIAYASELHSAMKATFSISLSYRGLALGVSLNPAHLHGRNNDMELNLSSYGNRLGGEIVYQSTKTFAGKVTKGNVVSKVESGLVSQTMLSANGYYAFNHRRFSYPAALSQTYRQRRSAGSWMLAASFWGGSIKTGGSEAFGSQPLDLHIQLVGIGGGYGHNFVVGNRWLFHISALPTFIVYSRNRMETDSEARRMDYHFPEVIITSRGAVVYHFKRYFTGMSMVASFLNIGDPDKLEISNAKWRGRLFFGVML